ncbi:MAG: MoaD/ThiS family protein [Gemmatimonadota bacterium]
MAVTVHIPTPLRKLTANRAEVPVEARTVGELVDGLEKSCAGIKEKLLDESGEIRRYVNLYVNDEDIRFLDGKGTVLKDGDSVSIVPAIAGGAPSAS